MAAAAAKKWLKWRHQRNNNGERSGGSGNGNGMA